MNTEPVKTYFVTDKFENKFPADFLSSRNKKYIVVQDCKCVIDGSMPSNVELHADFIKSIKYNTSHLTRDEIMDWIEKKIEYINTQLEKSRLREKADYKWIEKFILKCYKIEE